jgi:voltage-gated potassium channel
MNIKDSRVRRMIDVLSLVFTLEIVVSFIISTYSPPYQDILIKLDYIAILFFMFEFIYNFHYAEDKVRFFKDVCNIIDAVVVVAFLLYSLQIFYSKAIIGLRVINMIRILVLLRVIKLRRLEDNPAYINFITLLTICFISSCLIWIAEANVNENINNFFDAFYFTTISITTVGYGDITPKTDAGKLIIIFSVLTFISGLITSLQNTFKGEYGDIKKD